MKIYLTIILSFLLAPFVVFAAATDVTMSDSSKINVGGIDLVVSGTANFDSIAVDSDSFSLSMSGGSQLVVTSSDRRNFTVSPADYLKSISCGPSEAVVTIKNDISTTAVTVTVTPLTTLCISGGGGGSPSIGGGGGGGGGYSAPSVPSQVAVAPKVAVVTPTAPSPAAVAVSPVFTKSLNLGAASNDVKRLQQLLNSDPDTQIVSTGVGSSGNETEYFGNLTMKALQKFQAKYNIVSSGSPETTGYGALGPKTRAKLAEVFSKATPTAPSVAQPSPVAAAVSPVFSIGFTKGTTNTDIKRLQQLLNSDSDTKIAESGIGSPGSETEYFGSLTEKSLQKFQVKYGIAKEGDPGYGYLGPKTRAKFQELFK
jgi:hypothetical protein